MQELQNGHEPVFFSTIVNWLKNQAVDEQYLHILSLLVSTSVLLLVALFAHYITKHYILALVHKAIDRSENKLDDILVEHNIFNRLSSVTPTLAILVLTPILIPEQHVLHHLLLTVAKASLCFQIARVVSATLGVFKNIYGATAQEKYIPLNSTLQIVKLAIYIVATILAISYLVDKSPIYLLSGLGALTAVLLLVFQDTIKGLVASIQISANRMVAPGDWIELPKYGADGDVIEIGINTVKVKNFDKTITTIPTYALISGSFKNWRDMYSSGGRRIKRSIRVDLASIRFYGAEDLEKLAKFRLLKPYLATKQAEIHAWCQQHNIADTTDVNARQLTNLGTFRAYIEAYLKSHDKVHQAMTCMVRQLPADATGLPLELYFFSNDQDWINYEGIQADIFDHLYAIAPHFGLRIFQHPSGYDWQQNHRQGADAS